MAPVAYKADLVVLLVDEVPVYGINAEGKAEGRAEGRTEGRAQGEAKGKAELILRQLTRRFERLSAAVRLRIHSATPEQLGTIDERLLDAGSIDDVFADR